MPSGQLSGRDANASLADPVVQTEDPVVRSDEHNEDASLKRKASSPSRNLPDDVMVKKPRLRGQSGSRSRSRSRSRSPYQRRDQHYGRGKYRDRYGDRQSGRDRQRDGDRYSYRPREQASSMEPPPQREPDRRPSLSTEEKKRGQRFFRGLLSNLNREPRAAQQKHREEIERRQKEKVQQRKAAEEKRKAEDEKRRKKLARLEPIRKAEQIEFEQRAMRTRHSDLVSKAHSLKTRSGPPIYFQPWEMTKKQEEIVVKQVLKAEETVAWETRVFERRKQQWLAGLRDPAIERQGTAGEPRTENPVNTSLAVATNPSPPQSGSAEDRDDEMVVTEEETLVY